MTGPSELSEGVRIGRKLHRETPWGPEFGKRHNFEGDYFTVERQFVEKYLKRPSSVLIFGSGNGREARPIAADGHRIICFDIGFLYVKSGRVLCAREGLGNIHFLQADMHALPFAEEAFDFVFFSIYPAAGERRFGVLAGVREILRPGGMVMVFTLTPLYPRLHGGRLPRPDTVILAEDEMAGEIVKIEKCGFHFSES